MKTLTETQKKQIRENYDRINIVRLKEAAKTSEEARAAVIYYNRIKAGKARYAKGLKINGKILPATFQNQIKQDAKAAGMSLEEYWQKNRRIIADFYVNGYITKKKKAAEVLKLAEQKDKAGYKLVINKTIYNLVKFAAKLTEADAALISSMNASFILWKVNISDARKVLQINIDNAKIKKLQSLYRRKTKGRENE